MKRVQTYARHGRTGCVEYVARRRATGRPVGVYHAAQAGIDADPDSPWATVCEDHGTFVVHATLRRARISATDPEEFCDACRDAPKRRRE